MTVDDIGRVLAETKPAVVYIGGKTSTGKSTFGRMLRDSLGYQVIELEAVLLDIVNREGFDEKATFHKVFAENEESEQKTLFIDAVDKIISDSVKSSHPLVIEGAIANSDTLARVLGWASDLYFIYFHPTDINLYVRNLTKRFMLSNKESESDLPSKFWSLVDDEEFDMFCQTRELTNSLKQSIRQYALISQAESLTRLDEYKQRFENIIVVEVR